MFEGVKVKKSFIKRLPFLRGKGRFSAQIKPLPLSLEALQELPSGTILNEEYLIRMAVQSIPEGAGVRMGIKYNVEFPVVVTDAANVPDDYVPNTVSKGEKTNYFSDIWSLGVMLYEIFTGRAPFNGDTVRLLLRDIIRKENDPTFISETDLPNNIKAVLELALMDRVIEPVINEIDFFLREQLQQ